MVFEVVRAWLVAIFPFRQHDRDGDVEDECSGDERVKQGLARVSDHLVRL